MHAHIPPVISYAEGSHVPRLLRCDTDKTTDYSTSMHLFLSDFLRLTYSNNLPHPPTNLRFGPVCLYLSSISDLSLPSPGFSSAGVACGVELRSSGWMRRARTTGRRSSSSRHSRTFNNNSSNRHKACSTNSSKNTSNSNYHGSSSLKFPNNTSHASNLSLPALRRARIVSA